MTWGDFIHWPPGQMCCRVFKLLQKNQQTAINVSNCLWSDVYWNSLSDKICISFTNVHVNFYCLQNFAWSHKTIIKLINVLSCIVQMTGFWNSLSAINHMSRWPKGLRRPVEIEVSLVRFPSETSFFILNFRFFPFLIDRWSPCKRN